MKLIAGVPGSGKTELAINMAKNNPGETLYLSFSTENTRNSSERFAGSATCLSIHALAKRLLKIPQHRICDTWGKTHLHEALAATQSELQAADHHYFFEFFSKFIQLDVPIFRIRSLLSMPEFRLLSELKKAQLQSALLKIWDWIWLSGQQVTHDMYLKYASQQHLPVSFSLIIVDEAQDLSEAMMAFIESIEKSNPGAEIFLMADRCQQIFGYRGVSKKLNQMTPSQQLQDSHRFGGNIAQLMNAFMKSQDLSHYTPIHISEKKTEVSLFPGWDPLFTEAKAGRKLTVITRLNMSIWLLAKKLAKQEIPFAIKGNAIKDLHLLESLWRSCHAKKNGSHEYRRYKDVALSMNDRNAITACKLVESIPASDTTFFSRLRACLVGDAQAKVMLTNIHQAKGLQFYDVILAGDFQPCIEQNTGISFKIPVEEAHIVYTAITRCRSRLTVQSDWFSFYQRIQASASKNKASG